jgi:hypothetical protein
MKKLLLIVVVLIYSKSMFAQWETEWFPSELNIQSFTSNLLEARTGFTVAFGEERLRLDIGTSRDLLHYKNNEQTISVGADLFTYTRLRSEGNFKFPVETIDYYFGLNAAYKKIGDNEEIGARFRFGHVSTHLADGRYDNSTGEWIDGREPLVFSKEFVDLFPYYRFGGMRIYLGLTYIFSVVSDVINGGTYQVGFDYYHLCNCLSFIPFIAYDFKLSGFSGIYSGNNIVKLGIKFGEPYSRGISILLSYISGKSIHGQFFDLNENYFNLGFNLDM